MLASNETLIERLDKLEENYDAKFKIVFSAIRQLMNAPAIKRKPIGFRPRVAKNRAIRKKIRLRRAAKLRPESTSQ